MSTASIGKSATAAAISAIFLLATAGCDSGARAPASSSALANLNESRLVKVYEDQPNVLRARLDAASGRVWVLQRDGVDVYDGRSGAKLRSLALPEWIWANEIHACPPDLAVGPEGEVIVSSNVVPVLWRIDPASFEVSRRELAVLDERGREIGFSGMTYSVRQGAFLAVNGLDGSLWRIDRGLARAQHIPLSEPMPRACGVSARASGRGAVLGALCVQGEDREWTVHLTADQRSGYTHPGVCAPRDFAPTAKLQTSKTTF